MKKLFALTLVSLFVFAGHAQARVVYDSTGRHIVYDNTIRGQKRAAQHKRLNNRPAAAAKIEYSNDYFQNAINKRVESGRVKTVTTTVQDRQRTYDK